MSFPTSKPSTNTDTEILTPTKADEFEVVYEGMEGREVRLIPKTPPFSKNCIPAALSTLKNDHFSDTSNLENKITDLKNNQSNSSETNQESLTDSLQQTTPEGSTSAPSNTNSSQSLLGQMTAKISGITSYLWPGKKKSEK